MILSGILHTSLGGFTVIRGVAPLGELARCSRFDGAYQRNLIETHKEEIERFLADRQYLFFPEVVLSASLRFDFNAYKGKQPVAPIDDIIRTGKGFKSNVDGLSVKVVTTKLPKALETVGALNAPQLAYLELPEDQLDNGLKLFRIDGNHRLSAAQDLKSEEATYKLSTPFCIVLHDEPTEAQRFEKVVFHNINAKQIPLTSEENLRLILEDGKSRLFDDNILLESPSFGPPYYLARKLLAEIDERYLAALAQPLRNRRSLALALTQFLAGRDEAIRKAQDAVALDGQVPRLREALQQVNTIYRERPKLAANGCHGVLVAFLYFALHNEGKQLAAFARWVTSNRIDHLAPVTTTQGIGYHYHLGRVQAVDAASLVSVFESILTARHREIFISMAFRDETKETYETIKKTVRQINEKHKLDIHLREIRIDQFNKGHSYTIDDEILKVIEGSGLLIADLTFGNRNVYHEIGYLMGLNRGKGLEQDNFVLIADKQARGDELEKDIGFNLKSWQQLRFASTRQLEDGLTVSLETYYQLRGE
ncbi:MAG: hypothetical protein EG825_02740 [Rhodocyclaceae bacterium]|nr:hypothetical protein [Rhodocyclaceae bacterium]